MNRWFYQKTRKVFVNLFLIIASFTIAFLAGEVYFRLFNPQNIVPRYVETSPYGIRKNIGNVHGEMITSEYRHKFNTNSEGFRGEKEYSLEKPSGVYRIIVLGDSVALGHGVEDSETFSAVLEKGLSRTKPTEVINMGVSGFGTAEELIQLRNVGFKYEPDLIILTYFQNDPYNNIVSKLFKIEDGELVRDKRSFVPAIFIRDRLYKIPGYSFLSQHSHLLNFIRSRFSAYFQKKLGDKNRITSEVPRTLNPEQANLTASLINKIIVEANENKVPLIILNIPLIRKGEIYNNLPVKLVKDNKNTYIIDVQKQIYAGYPLKETAYYEIDGHPKPFVHKLIGDWLESFIRREILHEAQ